MADAYLCISGTMGHTNESIFKNSNTRNPERVWREAWLLSLPSSVLRLRSHSRFMGWSDHWSTRQPLLHVAPSLFRLYLETTGIVSLSPPLFTVSIHQEYNHCNNQSTAITLSVQYYESYLRTLVLSSYCHRVQEW
jgi:hypothetical protein